VSGCEGVMAEGLMSFRSDDGKERRRSRRARATKVQLANHMMGNEHSPRRSEPTLTPFQDFRLHIVAF
jgi:hypothetical protein